MEWFIAAAAIVALGVAATAAAGGGGGMSSEPVYDTYRQALPDHPLTAADLQEARFGVALRGYAMGQVDDLLERLGREIAERDALIAALTSSDGELTELAELSEPTRPPAADVGPVRP